METRLRSRTGSGSQTITDLTGPVDASTGSGDLDASRDPAPMSGRSSGSGGMEIQDVGSFIGHAGSGRITASRVRGAVEARAGSGHIDIAQTGEGDVDVQTGSGGIDDQRRAASASRPRRQRHDPGRGTPHGELGCRDRVRRDHDRFARGRSL